ncbi:hypothetical protein CAEBREN_06513 [Caenorhabditis brenneri]|uniref:Uncharacterized protein n=1 Tax=Caenorhabditis brenneri TaxID=135651 RepID=G0M9V7_CAEBE|nr:hypothetical protein CAEBREN_06513 [Caenorhabditis brenneri]
MAKTKVTTQNPLSELYELNGLGQEVYEKLINFLIGYGVLFLLLLLIFFGLLVPYVKTFTKHSQAFGLSPLLPLVNHSNSMIKRFYPALIILVGASFILGELPGTDLNRGCYILSMLATAILFLSIKSFVSVYQFVISIITFRTVMNSRDPHGMGWKFTRSNIITLTTISYIIAVLRECLLFFYVIFMVIIDNLLKSENIEITYMFLPTASGTSIYEAYIIFVSIDMVLVPLVIEITELRMDPNVVQTWEMKSQQPKV